MFIPISVGKMTLKLYVDYASQPCRALAMFFRAAKIPHEIVMIKFVTQEHKSEKITKLNPFQIVNSKLLFLKNLWNMLFLDAFCWARWDGSERIYGHFEVRYQGVWCAWALVSKGNFQNKNHKPNGDYFNFIGFAWWTKSQRIFTLATFGHSPQLRHVLPG